MDLYAFVPSPARWTVALLSSAIVLSGCKSSTGADPLPSTIHVCETNTATLCSDWTLNGNAYAAVWPQGSAASIQVTRFSGDTIVFDRADLPGTTTPDMRARYTARPTGRSVTGGDVDWTTGGNTFRGRWTATW